MYKLTGQVVFITQEEQPTDKFRFRELWVFQDGQNPQTICIQFANDRISLLSGITLKSMVEVSFWINGRINTPMVGKQKCYNTLVGTDVNKLQ